MGSTSLSSASLSLSLSEDASDGREVLKGSLRYVDDGTLLANSPKVCLLEVWDEGRRRRRVGRSEALRMVGLAFSGSAMMQGGAKRGGTGDGMG